MENRDPIHATLDSYYKLPDLWAAASSGKLQQAGSFRFGTKLISYGAGSDNGTPSPIQSQNGPALSLPLNISEVIESLRYERYVELLGGQSHNLGSRPFVRSTYYHFRNFIPAGIRRYLQRSYLSGWKTLPFPGWPVDFTVDLLHQECLRRYMKSINLKSMPFIWFWPNGAPSALILTHDVETVAGRNATSSLMDLDAAYGFRASIQVVPEKRYDVPPSYVQEIRDRGFEFNVHDLNHDGHLYENHAEFLRRAAKINEYVAKFQARGFRSGAMYRNLSWYNAFEFSYDMSVPNVAHLEPQRGGCCTIMPYFVGEILEIPLTTTQDYSLFYIINDYSIELWKEQIDLIHKAHGLLSFIAHPDYLIEPLGRDVYAKLLNYLAQFVEAEGVWVGVAGDIDTWWRLRQKLKLVSRGNRYEIVGEGNERARIAYAHLDGDGIEYEIVGAKSQEQVRL